MHTYAQYIFRESGRRIQRLRHEQHKGTQQQVADDLGLTPGSYGNIERGTKGISIDTAIMIARYYNVTIDYILTGADPDIRPYVDAIMEACQHIIQHC